MKVKVEVEVVYFIKNLKHKCFYNDCREHVNVNCEFKNAWLNQFVNLNVYLEELPKTGPGRCTQTNTKFTGLAFKTCV